MDFWNPAIASERNSQNFDFFFLNLGVGENNQQMPLIFGGGACTREVLVLWGYVQSKSMLQGFATICLLIGWLYICHIGFYSFLSSIFAAPVESQIHAAGKWQFRHPDPAVLDAVCSVRSGAF